MVRLSTLPEDDRNHLLAKACPQFKPAPWVAGPPLGERRIAIVTTAGLHRAGDDAYAVKTADYRVIPGDLEGRDLTMSHSSVNFDRTGFQQDVNVVFPIDRFRELENEGVIGSLGRFHYSFMSAFSEPELFEPTGREVAGFLRDDGVDSVFLSPV